MKDFKFNAKSFNLLLIGLVVFIVLAGAVLSFFSVMTLNKLSEEVSENKYIASKNNSKIEELSKLENTVRGMTAEESKLNKYLPGDKEVSVILKDLETMANQDSLTFSVYQVGKLASQDTKQKDESQLQKSGSSYVFPFEITLTGSFENVNKMMEKMESYSRLVEVKDLKYYKDTQTSGDIVSATLQMNAYLEK